MRYIYIYIGVILPQGKTENNPYINPPDQPKVIQTENNSEFKSYSVPH